MRRHGKGKEEGTGEGTRSNGQSKRGLLMFDFSEISGFHGHM